jgi:hypothetical protein
MAFSVIRFSWDYVAALRFPFLRGPSSTKSKSASAGADADFLHSAVAYESELSTLRQNTKKMVMMPKVVGESIDK